MDPKPVTAEELERVFVGKMVRIVHGTRGCEPDIGECVKILELPSGTIRVELDTGSDFGLYLHQLTGDVLEGSVHSHSGYNTRRVEVLGGELTPETCAEIIPGEWKQEPGGRYWHEEEKGDQLIRYSVQAIVERHVTGPNFMARGWVSTKSKTEVVVTYADWRIALRRVRAAMKLLI